MTEQEARNTLPLLLRARDALEASIIRAGTDAESERVKTELKYAVGCVLQSMAVCEAKL